MRAVLAVLLLLSVASCTPAYAGGIVSVSTMAGAITVASNVADRFSGFIGDVVARGFRGRVHCFARGGHVRHSNHYTGQACDFAQRGWGRTVAPMYHVRDLAAKWGLRDGCSFGDCGHIDLPRLRLVVVSRHRVGRHYRRYARA